MEARRRAQILLDREDYSALARIARQQRTSVSELIKAAVRERFLGVSESRGRALRKLMQMELPVIDWEEIEREVADGHDDGLPR